MCVCVCVGACLNEDKDNIELAYAVVVCPKNDH